MSYKYSICHPDKSEIEYPNQILSEKEVKEKVLNYPWINELKKMKLMKEDDIHYSPSLDFTNNNDNYSFCLSAITELDKLSFYIFYNRPIMKKVLFGLLGEKEKFDVIDKMFNENEAFDLLDKFIKKDYKFIENKMNQ